MQASRHNGRHATHAPPHRSYMARAERLSNLAGRWLSGDDGENFHRQICPPSPVLHEGSDGSHRGEILPQNFRIIGCCSCSVRGHFETKCLEKLELLLMCPVLPRLGSWVRIPSPAPIFPRTKDT